MLAQDQDIQLQDLSDLEQYIYESVCDDQQLVVGAFPMTQRILVRSGKACGIYFCVHGPRSVKFTAIWETDHNTILFYDSSGERIRKIQLVTAPVLTPVAA